MHNKIVFTQDLPGERDWLKNCFPNSYFFETEYSGKWPTKLFVEDYDSVWEIPPESNQICDNLAVDIYKSLYSTKQKFISPKWVESDFLLINDIEFTNQPRSAKAQVLHLPRSGTGFMESILFHKCGYDKDRNWQPVDTGSDHWCLGWFDDKSLYDIVNKSKPDIFFCYRKNWWEWFLSFQIAVHHGYYHHFDSIDWDNLSQINITEKQLASTMDMVRSQWNSLCHFRTQFPNLNFYIFEFTDLIKNQKLTSHSQIQYNKSKLISNYNELKHQFESNCSALLEQWTNRALLHLSRMNCKILTNFDSLLTF